MELGKIGILLVLSGVLFAGILAGKKALGPQVDDAFHASLTVFALAIWMWSKSKVAWRLFMVLIVASAITAPIMAYQGIAAPISQLICGCEEQQPFSFGVVFRVWHELVFGSGAILLVAVGLIRVGKRVFHNAIYFDNDMNFQPTPKVHKSAQPIFS